MPAFYVKGTNRKVRTSATMHYTHALMTGPDGKVLSCHTSRALAEKAAARIGGCYLPQFAEEVLSTKLFWMLEISPNGALKAMRKYDYRTYGKMLERPIKARRYFQNEPYYGFDATEEELAEAAERVAKKQAILANRVIVELEERIR